MKNLKLLGLTLIVVSIVLSSCAPIYIPNNVNMPLLTKKKEGTVSANFGTNGFNYQAAYALNNNLAFMFNGVSFSERISDNKIIGKKHKIKFHEVGVGYFNKFTNDATFESYIGGGFGEASVLDNFNIFTNSKVYGEGKFHKLFVQAGAVQLVSLSKVVLP